MDVEKTMQFILKQQAKTDKRLEEITKLLHTGIKLVIEIKKAQKSFPGGRTPEED